MTRLRLNGTPDRRFGARGAQPDRWCTGPDPVTHRIYRWWLVHRAQAHHRGEPYALTFDQYHRWWLTQDRWQRRGRRRGGIIMRRIDPREAWSPTNIQPCERSGFYTHRRGRPR